MGTLGYVIAWIFVLFGAAGWVLIGIDVFKLLTGKLIRPKPPILTNYVPPFQDLNPLSRHRMGQ